MRQARPSSGSSTRSTSPAASSRVISREMPGWVSRTSLRSSVIRRPCGALDRAYSTPYSRGLSSCQTSAAVSSWAIVGLGGQAFIAKRSQDAVHAFRPFFEGSPIYGKSYRLEDFMAGTPLSVGSPQEVIEKTLEFQEGFGDYQRQLWNVDAMGLPLEMALEQVELLGTEVVPVLRKEM